MTVQSRLFSSNSKSWEALCDEAATFASEVGRERLINIRGGIRWNRVLGDGRYRRGHRVVLGVRLGAKPKTASEPARASYARRASAAMTSAAFSAIM